MLRLASSNRISAGVNCCLISSRSCQPIFFSSVPELKDFTPCSASILTKTRWANVWESHNLVRLSIIVSRPRNTLTVADGACEVRSRSEEKAMQGHRRRRATQRSPATPISPKGGGGTASISLSLLLHDAHRHRVVVASRTRRRRDRHKGHGIPGTRHWPGLFIPVCCSAGIIRPDCATRSGCPSLDLLSVLHEYACWGLGRDVAQRTPAGASAASPRQPMNNPGSGRSALSRINGTMKRGT